MQTVLCMAVKNKIRGLLLLPHVDCVVFVGVGDEMMRAMCNAVCKMRLTRVLLDMIVCTYFVLLFNAVDATGAR